MIAEFEAVKAQLEADTRLVVRDTVYDAQGAVVQGTYVVLFGGGPDTLNDERVTKQQEVTSDSVTVYTVRSVSTTPAGVRSALEHVLTQLVGFIPTVEGRVCDAVQLTHSVDVQPDASVKPILFFCDNEFSLSSRTA